ncbi:MAG: hypothetical protein M3040_04910 [Bacteroidota bacterium]|nr:hypothetical protein [Bacteroidota bacterium]
MKKVFALLVILFAASGSVLMAQGGGNMDPAQMRERQLTQLKSSDLKLTDVQADSVIAVQMEMRQQMRGLRDLPEDQRAAKRKEMNDMMMKRWTSALKDEALAKRVAEYYEKQRAARANGGGGPQ